MTRHRTRGPLSPTELDDLYEGHDWSVFVQAERDTGTIELGTSLPPDEVTSIADLSCGGANITPTIAARYGVTPVLGDLSPQYGYPIVGPIEDTIETIEPVDLFVCSETLEHLEDPDTVLKQIHDKCERILVTTPVWEEPHMPSHGHLWTWRRDNVEEMFAATGFTPETFVGVSLFGLWVCHA